MKKNSVPSDYISLMPTRRSPYAPIESPISLIPMILQPGHLQGPMIQLVNTHILDPATNTWVQKDEPGTNYAGSSMPETKTDEKTEQIGGNVNYAGMSIAALKPSAIEATTPILPPDSKVTNLDVAGDAVFHGKATFISGLHVEWYDASQPAGTDIVIDLANGPHQFIVLGENKTIWIPSKPDDELMFSLLILQDDTGAWTVDWQINGGDQETDGLPLVYWPGGTEPVMTATADTCDMYSFTWMAFLNDGKGAYVGMTTQDMRVPEAPA